MKKTLRAFSLILCVVFMFSAFPAVCRASAGAEDWEYSVVSDGKIQLTKYLGSSTVVDIPSTLTVDVDGNSVTYTVIKLGDGLFASTAEGTGSTVTSVTIPSTVLYTGSNIFYNNTNITTLVINSNGIELNVRFARGASNLTSITINGYVKSLGKEAFMNVGASKIVFPEGLTSVEDNSLRAYYLTDITIPSTIASASGNSIIYGTSESDIKRITIRVPDTATEAFVRTNFKWSLSGVGTVFYGPMVVGDGFESDPAKWSSSDQNHEYGNHAVTKYIGNAEKAVIPTYDWKGIAIDHIWGATSAFPTTLMIPETVNLFKDVLKDNTNIVNLIVNSTITKDHTFQRMPSLKTVKVNGTISANYVFFNCQALETAEISDIKADISNIFHTNPELNTLTCNGNVPENTNNTITLIHGATCPKFKKLIIGANGNITGAITGNISAAYQFSGVTGQLEEIEVHGTINKTRAFGGISALKTVKIYNTATVIGNQVFYNNANLKNLWFEENTTIGAEDADVGNYFQNCTGLEEVVIPAGSKFYGYAVFNGCTSLRKVTLCEGCYSKGTLLYGLTSVKHILVNGACNVNLGLGAATVHYYMTEWYEGLSLTGVSSATVRTVRYNTGDILKDTGDDMLAIERDGFLFAGYIVNPKAGQPFEGADVEYSYVYENNLPASFAQTVFPKFVRAICGDVNGDNKVNLLDLIRYKKQMANVLYPVLFVDELADLNDDGVMDANDLTTLKQFLLDNTDTLNTALSARYTFADNVTLSEKISTTVGTVSEFNNELAYAHAPFIEYYNGRFYCFWMAGTTDEDADGQQIMWSYSDDAELWEEPMVLSEAQYATETESKVVQYPAGFTEIDGKLYADYSVNRYDSEGEHFSATYFRAKLADDGIRFEAPVTLETNAGSHITSFYANGYYYKTAGTGVRISVDGSMWQTLGLTNGQIALAEEQGATLCEASLYITSDSVYHLLMRGQDGYIWHSTSLDRCRTWSDPVRTSMKNENSKFCVGQIKSGSREGYYYIISNIENTGTQDRNPLYISLSIDGYEFNETYILENDEYTLQQEGNGKGGAYAYPSCTEYIDELGNTCFAVAYSCGKEEIRVSTFTLD